MLASKNRIGKKSLEITNSIGSTTFWGDVGGGRGNGSNSIRDYDLKATRPVVSIGLLYVTKSFYAFHGQLSLGHLGGSDKYTTNPVRYNRNLSFRSPFIEFSTQAQVFIGKNQSGNLYRVKNANSRTKRINIKVYAFVGMGFLYFNPQAKYNGHWVNLQPLGTEGQGIAPGSKLYSRFTFVIPAGLGIMTFINKRMKIGIDVGLRKTFTDYLDDVSTTYYDNDVIRAKRGDAAAYLADPNLGLISNATTPNEDGTGAQRGGPKYKDAYAFFQVTASYKIFARRASRAKF